MKNWKNPAPIVVLAVVFVLTGFRSSSVNDVEFVCMKTHKASNTCHFNFRMDGASYRYVDIGCKYQKKQETLIKKVQEGSLFLAKDWKVNCQEPKPLDDHASTQKNVK